MIKQLGVELNSELLLGNQFNNVLHGFGDHIRGLYDTSGNSCKSTPFMELLLSGSTTVSQFYGTTTTSTVFNSLRIR